MNVGSRGETQEKGLTKKKFTARSHVDISNVQIGQRQGVSCVKPHTHTCTDTHTHTHTQNSITAVTVGSVGERDTSEAH